VPPAVGLPGGGMLPLGAPSESKTTPAEAVLSLDATVLLVKFTTTASRSETPPPVQPATLLAKMLLVIETQYQSVVPGRHVPGVLGLFSMSFPLHPKLRPSN